MNAVDKPMLVSFDPDKSSYFKLTAAKMVWGAYMLQDGKPIDYVITERRYAQIEKELLPIVFGSRKIRLVNGRKVTFQTDHKPLATIV